MFNSDINFNNVYLFLADMMDDSDIKHHDIVPGAAIQLEVWCTWKTLIKAAADGEIDQVILKAAKTFKL